MSVTREDGSVCVCVSRDWENIEMWEKRRVMRKGREESRRVTSELEILYLFLFLQCHVPEGAEVLASTLLAG